MSRPIGAKGRFPTKEVIFEKVMELDNKLARVDNLTKKFKDEESIQAMINVFIRDVIRRDARIKELEVELSFYKENKIKKKSVGLKGNKVDNNNQNVEKVK